MSPWLWHLPTHLLLPFFLIMMILPPTLFPFFMLSHFLLLLAPKKLHLLVSSSLLQYLFFTPQIVTTHLNYRAQTSVRLQPLNELGDVPPNSLAFPLVHAHLVHNTPPFSASTLKLDHNSVASSPPQPNPHY